MHKLKHSIVAAIIAVLALSNAAMAEGTLVPGKPAGVKSAQMIGTDALLGLGLAAVAIGVTIGVTSGSGNNSSSVSTSTTS
jgi:hypothetical protein